MDSLTVKEFDWLIGTCDRHELYARSVDLMVGDEVDKVVSSIIQRLLYMYSMKQLQNVSDGLDGVQDKIPHTLEIIYDKLSKKDSGILNCM